MRKKSTLLTYTICYGGLFLYCALVAMLLCGWLLNQYKEEAVHSAAQKMETAAVAIEQLVADQRELSREIYFHSLTAPKSLGYDELSAIKGIEQLRLFSKTLSVNDWLITFYYPDSYITHKGRVSPNTFWTRTMNLSALSLSDCEQLLEISEENYTVLQGQAGERNLLYLYPVPNKYEESILRIGYVISEDSLAKYLRTMLPDTCCTLLTTDQGEIITRLNTSRLTSEDAERLHAALINNETTENLGFVSFFYSLGNGMKLYVAVDTDLVLARFNILSQWVLILLILSTAVVAIVLWYINLRNVKPIWNLKNLVHEHSDSMPKADEKNELQVVHEAITQIYAKQKEHMVSRRQYQLKIAEELTALLLSGVAGKEKIINDLIQTVSPGMQESYYVVIGIQFPKQFDPYPLIDMVTEHLFSVVCKADVQEDYAFITIIAALSDLDTECTSRKTLCAKIMALTTAFAIKPMIVCGSVYQSMRDIVRSHNEMVVLWSYRREQPVHATGISIFELAAEEDQNLISTAHLYNIKRMLEMHDFPSASIICNDILANIRLMELEVHRVYADYVFVIQLTKLMKDYPARQLTDLRTVCGKESHVFEKEFLNALSNLFVAVQPEMTLAEEIILYIDAHYCDKDISLDSLGSRFNMSGSNVSKQVKAQTGSSYSDYLSKLRLEYAKELLEKTDLSIKDILYKVGYTDLSSFIRKFKSLFSETPGEYRARMRETTDADE